MEEKELQSPAAQDQRGPNHLLPEFQYLNLQLLTIHRTAPTQNPAISSKSEKKQVSLRDLVPLIVPQLDKDKFWQLLPHYTQLLREEISIEKFFRLMKGIVGVQIIKKALYELKAQTEAQLGSSQLLQSSSPGHRKLINSDVDVSRHIPSSASEIKVKASEALADINGQISQAHWHSSSQDKLTDRQVQQDMNRLQYLPIQSQRVENQPIQSPIHQVAESQSLTANQNPANLQQTYNKQRMSTQNPTNTSKNRNQVSFAQLVPVLVPLLHKDKSIQLKDLFHKFRRNEVSKEGFLSLMKEIVGDQILKMALYKLQTQAEVQAGSRQLPQSSSPGHQKLIDSHADVCSHIPSSAPEIKFESNDAISDINGHISQAHLSAMVENKSQNLPIQCQRAPTHQVGESQYPMENQNPENLQQTSNKQTVSSQNPANTLKKLNQVSFGQLVLVIVPQLDKDKVMQLKDLYIKLKTNKVSKEGFLRLMKVIVGNQMINTALYKLQKQAKSQDGSSKLPQLSSRLPWKPIPSQQKISIQNAANTSMNRKQVSFGKLFPEIVLQLDTDKKMQLQALYIKLKRNEVSKEGFVSLMTEIVGDQVIKTALSKLQTQAAQNSQTGPSQVPNFCS